MKRDYFKYFIKKLNYISKTGSLLVGNVYEQKDNLFFFCLVFNYVDAQPRKPMPRDNLHASVT